MTQRVTLHVMCKFIQNVEFYTYFVILQIQKFKYICEFYSPIFIYAVLSPGNFCRKFTRFLSVKFSGMKMCECKKMTNMRYAGMAWLPKAQKPKFYPESAHRKLIGRWQADLPVTMMRSTTCQGVFRSGNITTWHCIIHVTRYQ